MAYDPAWLDALAMCFVEAAVREMENEYASGGADQANRRGVKDERCKDYHDSGGPSAVTNIQSA